MKPIYLKKKKVVLVDINNKKCVAALDDLAIDNFQRTNKMGFLNAMKKAEEGDVLVIKRLLASLIRDKKSGQPLGMAYFNQFDNVEVLTYLSPILEELFPDNLPKAKNEDEKK